LQQQPKQKANMLKAQMTKKSPPPPPIHFNGRFPHESRTADSPVFPKPVPEENHPELSGMSF